MQEVDDLLRRAVEDKVFPGGQLVVVDDGEPIFGGSFGVRAYGGPAVTDDTFYDVASLTKPLVTATVALRSIQRGQITLDSPVSEYLPEFKQPQVRVGDLLCHVSGLPAWRPFYETCHSREEIIAAAAATPLEYETGTRAVYSDLGFILLGALLERAETKRLDRLAAADLDLGAHFVDLTRRERPTPVAATEGNRAGEVHDENCHAAGGVLGHAGLFATADQVSKVTRNLVDSWHGKGPFPTDLMRKFWEPTGIGTWRLGWDGPAESGSAAGERWPKTGVGHLGFTGCSLWVDPPRRRWVVLLTNRVHPSRDDERIKQVRPALHDAVVDALGG